MCEHKHFGAIVLVTSFTGYAEDRRYELIVFTAGNLKEIELFLERLIFDHKDDNIIACTSSIKILTDGKEDENLSSQMKNVLMNMVEGE